MDAQLSSGAVPGIRDLMWPEAQLCSMVTAERTGAPGACKSCFQGDTSTPDCSRGRPSRGRRPRENSDQCTCARCACARGLPTGFQSAPGVPNAQPAPQASAVRRSRASVPGRLRSGVRRRRRGPAVRARAGGARPWAGVRRRASGLCGRRWRSGARRGSAWRWTWQKRRPARDSRDPDSRVRRAPTAAQLRPPVSPRARALPPGAWASRGAPQPGALRARPSPGAGLKGRGCPRRGSKPPLLTEQLGAGVPSGMGCGGSGSRVRRARAGRGGSGSRMRRAQVGRGGSGLRMRRAGRGGSGSRVRRACCAAVQEV